MAYTKKTWVSGETPLSAENMNNIENGIANAHEDISKLNTKISSMYLERTTVTLTGESHAIKAPSIDGRVFMCWISASTREWVGSVYIENPSQTSTNVWKSVGAGGIVDCYALYRNS